MQSTQTATPGQDSAWSALRDRVSIQLRPIGSPTSIGFLGLAAASLTLSGLQLGWLPVDQSRQVGLILIAFGFAAQLLTAVFSLLARDATAGTAMTVLGLTWLVIGLVLETGKPGATSPALGMLLLTSTVAMIMTAATAGLSKLVPALVFLTAGVRFFAAAMFQLTAADGWQRTAGILGLALVLLALYAAFAAELEAALHRSVLPLGRRGDGWIAQEGSLYEQVKQVAHEPGVRQQL